MNGIGHLAGRCEEGYSQARFRSWELSKGVKDNKEAFPNEVNNHRTGILDRACLRLAAIIEMLTPTLAKRS